MRKALLIISMITGIFTSSLFAQTVEVEWGGFKDLPKKTRFNKIIGQDSDKIYLIRSEKDKSLKNSIIWLESVSKTSSMIESSYEIQMPKVYTKTSTFEDIYYIDGKLILFVSVIDPIKERSNLYAYQLDEDGVTKSEPLKLGSIASGLGDEFGFKFVVSEDSKKITVAYNVMFSTYGGEPFYYKVIDADLNIVDKKTFEMPFKQRKFDVLDFQRGESGNYYFSIRAEPTKKRRSNPRGGKAVKKTYLYYLLVHNAKKDSFQNYKVLVEKYNPASISMTVDKEENVLLFGYGTKRSSMAYSGIYYQKLNPRIEKFVFKRFLDFYKDRTFMAEFKQERNGTDETQLYSSTKGEIVYLHNGSTIFLSEQYYVNTRTIVDPKTEEETIIYYYNYNDILVASFDEDGKPEWYRRVPKNQFSTNDKGYYSSFAVTVDMNKVKLIYNDHPKNLKNKNFDKTKQLKNNINTYPDGEAVLTTIYSDGNVDKAPMFMKEDSRTSVCPKLFIESDGQYYIYGQKGGDFKFGNFFFE